jgi:hypothetical protein
MKKKKVKKNKQVDEVVVALEEFNATLGKLLKAKPLPMKKIKTTGKRSAGSMFLERKSEP